MSGGFVYPSLIALLIPYTLWGQYEEHKGWELGGSAGISNYTGDAQYHPLSMRPQPLIGISAYYRQSLRLSWSAELSHHRLKGKTLMEQSALPAEASFDTQLTELRLGTEYNWYRYGSHYSYLGTKNWTPFVGGGLGLVWAREQKQVLSPSLYIALGIKYQLSPKLQIRLRGSWHYSTSDRLDALGSNEALARPIGLEGTWSRHGDSWTELSIGLSWLIYKDVKNCD